MTWYSLSQTEKVNTVYSKFTIKQFWDWWSNGNTLYMEIRMPNYQFVKRVAGELSIPYSSSGVYVWNSNMLKNVIIKCRNESVMWFGVNPRKKNYLRKWNGIGFGSGDKGGSSDENIACVMCLFIDIDRVIKKGQASNEELQSCDVLAEKILEKLGTQGWNKNYCKICSGNGVQLVIKLDYPIQLPVKLYDRQHKVFMINEEFEQLKNVIKTGIGKQILQFTRKYKKELGVEVDNTCFNIMRVGALPFTKNFKHDGYTWRGILNIKDGENSGLSDYILQVGNDKKQYVKQNVFSVVKQSHLLKKGQLRRNVLIKYFLNNTFPDGGINNTFWFSIKLLLRDSNIDLQSVEFRRLHEELKQKHNRSLTLNLPEKKYKFSVAAVNRYCVIHGLPLVYSSPTEFLGKQSVSKNNWGLENLQWQGRELHDSIQLGDGSIFDDINECRDRLNDKKINIPIFYRFVNGLVDKYGEDYVKKLFEYNILYLYLTYQ